MFLWGSDRSWGRCAEVDGICGVGLVSPLLISLAILAVEMQVSTFSRMDSGSKLEWISSMSGSDGSWKYESWSRILCWNGSWWGSWLRYWWRHVGMLVVLYFSQTLCDCLLNFILKTKLNLLDFVDYCRHHGLRQGDWIKNELGYCCLAGLLIHWWNIGCF